MRQREYKILMFLLMYECNENPNFQAVEHKANIRKFYREVDNPTEILSSNFKWFNMIYRDNYYLNPGRFNDIIEEIQKVYQFELPLLYKDKTKEFIKTSKKVLNKPARFFDDYFEFTS